MKSFRPERVGHLIREVVSEAISSRLNDPRVETLSSVTRVEVTADLEHAKVWISVIGTDAVQRRTLAGLKSATGFIQSMVARELRMRTCPRLTFRLDESIKRGEEVLRLIEQTMAESRQRDSQREGPEEAPGTTEAQDEAGPETDVE